ncbi:MAG: AmmeMemoRadiSam system protein B [Omnitrophica bacterium RIFCSPLOWO2_02_FULL_45_16]|nr:MAG: AmmeMemoRadiSam system protein B [Omnitrophica bacterium RIFCSPHIGHO2_02_FULL_46_20]OGW93754.1 MAG: AmmeMemoRadiSam system protein B [Omnitrophica bacterium RIFCSPLOWO2_01_FULL_45_24]OGW94097.1 MAG: AmmeMemoRadiSam system protein B [Omnitrophica bacterium RIFCSPLOWO2_12_FULL_45_13]OGX00840.1 MAG: AmmeMemoRadiSam system protein B [Omnitrophica bacterium RIFCSPLOWO2_02_FULL_45_16]
MVRNPAVAGQFYSGSKESLAKEVRGLIDETAGREDAIGVVSPHAGYVYSGLVAGSTLSSIKSKSTYIILGPNHTGLGSPFSISVSDSWKTPLGEVSVSKALSDKILKNCPDIKEDELAHIHEHSIEVQLPFLQALQKDLTFVPIVISLGSLETYRNIGEGLAKSVKELKIEKDITIIASSDMTHYESRETAKAKDSKAIDAILKLDEKSLVERIEKFDISMCGFAPAAIMIVAAKKLGAASAHLIKYQTSGEVSGDYSSVVGYAGIIIS